MFLPKSCYYRLFSFHLDGEFRTVRLDWEPGLSYAANAENLYQRFHATMEQHCPGCFRDGRITHLGYVDGTTSEGTTSEGAPAEESAAGFG